MAIATLSAVLAAVGRAGQLGVLVKGGGALENLGTLRAIAFDKTGTLTEGKPRLTDVAPVAGVDELELLSVAVAVESRSDHPLAAAIVRDGNERLADRILPDASGVTAITGRGVRATIGGTEVLIGNAALMGDDLAKLPIVIGLSRKASRIIRQNLYLSLGMVAFLIPATIVGIVGIARGRVPRRLHPRRRQGPATAPLPQGRHERTHFNRQPGRDVRLVCRAAHSYYDRALLPPGRAHSRCSISPRMVGRSWASARSRTTSRWST